MAKTQELKKDFGLFIRWQANKAGGLAQARNLTGVGEKTIKTWSDDFRTPEDANMREGNAHKFAKGLGFEDWHAFVTAYEATPPERYRTLPNDTDPAPAHPPVIPEWDCEIAAGHWIDSAVCQLDYEKQQDVVNRGMFIIRVRGDSMKPKYPTGCRVLFRIIRFDVEGLVVGRVYYFENSDGQCTMKRLAARTEEHYTLKADNKKYKQPIILPVQMLTRAAEVVGRIESEE